MSVFPQETVFSSRTKNRAFYITSSVSTNRQDGWLPINEWLKHNQKCLTSTWIAYDHEWSLPTLCAWPCVCPLLWYAKQDRLRGSLVCGRLRNSQLWHISFRSLWSNKLNWSSKYKRSEQKSISCLNILLCVYFYNLSFFTYLGHFTWVTLISACWFISSPDSDAKTRNQWQRYLYTNFHLKNYSFQILTSENTINVNGLIKPVVKSNTSSRVLVTREGGLYGFQQGGLERIRLWNLNNSNQNLIPPFNGILLWLILSAC